MQRMKKDRGLACKESNRSTEVRLAKCQKHQHKFGLQKVKKVNIGMACEELKKSQIGQQRFDLQRVKKVNRALACKESKM